MYITHSESIDGQQQNSAQLKFGDIAIKISDCVDMAALAALEDAQVEGEPDLVVELIDLYFEDSSDKLAAIGEAISKTDEPSLRRATHGLRGSSASLGAHRVAALCWELEQTGLGDSSLEHIEALRSVLEHECELVRQVLAAERLRRTHAYLPLAT
jgi:two-component system, sensor histidine kinase and response regulator